MVMGRGAQPQWGKVSERPLCKAIVTCPCLVPLVTGNGAAAGRRVTGDTSKGSHDLGTVLPAAEQESEQSGH